MGGIKAPFFLPSSLQKKKIFFFFKLHFNLRCGWNQFHPTHTHTITITITIPPFSESRLFTRLLRFFAAKEVFLGGGAWGFFGAPAWVSGCVCVNPPMGKKSGSRFLLGNGTSGVPPGEVGGGGGKGGEFTYWGGHATTHAPTRLVRLGGGGNLNEVICEETSFPCSSYS